MTQDEIIRMAREAGFPDPTISANWYATLERFFDLAFADGAAHERENCAMVCDEYHYEIGGSCKDCAAAIRARGDK